MSAKSSFSMALLMTVASLCHAQGQNAAGPAESIAPPVLGNVPVGQPAYSGASQAPGGPGAMPAITSGPMGMPMQADSASAGDGTIAQSSGLSSWILYTKPDCCGPMGAHGPILAELYARQGVSIPVGGGVLGFALDTGYMFQGGGRSMFYNTDLSAAWVAEIGIAYNFNQGISGHLMQIVVPGQQEEGPVPLQMRRLQRTAFTWSFGHESLLWVWPQSGLNLRGGLHVGGQLGTVKAEWLEIPHTTDMLWAVTLAANLDVEYPWGCTTLVGGFRVEWADIFESDIVQHQNNNSLQSVNLLVNGGFRF